MATRPKSFALPDFYAVARGRDQPRGHAANEESFNVRSMLATRPRLLAQMAKGVQRPLTVVTAPAGYGKTVLVEQWTACQSATPVTWLSFGAEDTGGRLAAKFLAASGRLTGDLSTALRAWQPESEPTLGRELVDMIIDRLARVGDAVLVIDGLDAPASGVLADDLWGVLKRLPPNIRTIVTQRSWRSATSRLSSERGRATTIGAAELAFTPMEARLLVRRAAGRELTDAQLEALMARTEGWPVALNVAAVALRGPACVDRVIDGLRGSEKRIAAFLRDEVLAKQPASLRSFLVRTAVLDSLTAPLCTAVSGDAASGVMLRHLEQSGTFLRRDPTREASYVHHRLFREVLRHELRASDPEAERELLVRAGLCHLSRGEPELAGAYLADAEEWDRLIDLLDQHGCILLERGKADLVLAWLDRVPRSSPRHADVMLRRAVVLTMLGRAGDVVQIVRDVEAPQACARTRLILDVLRAMSVFGDAPPDAAVEAADAVLEAIDQQGQEVFADVLGMTSTGGLRAMAEGSRARAAWYAGDVESSRHGLSEVLSRPDLHPVWRLQLLSAAALLEAWAGNLRTAHVHAMHALLLAHSRAPDHPATVESYLALAHVAREQGDLSRAEALLDRSHTLATRLRRSVPFAIYAYERARWYLADGAPSRGLAELDAYSAIGQCPPPVVDTRLRAVEVQLLLALGDPARAERVIATSPSPLGAALASAAVHAAVARHDLQSARARLEAWEPAAGEPQNGLERELWLAITDFEAGNRRVAVDRFARIAATASHERHVRLFLDSGPPGERLLRILVSLDPAVHPQAFVRSASSRARHADTGPAFSPRELEVVRFLPTTLSNAEIAAQLFVSLNTLKTHLRTVYRKLGANSRSQAIVRAEELGLA